MKAACRAAVCLSLCCSIITTAAHAQSRRELSPATDEATIIAEIDRECRIAVKNDSDVAVRQNECLTCISLGGYTEGTRSGNHDSPSFPCNDVARKQQAIRALLANFGIRNPLSCSGFCISGTCGVSGLMDSNIDGCDLTGPSDDGNGNCHYNLNCPSPHTPSVYPDCGCN